MYNDKLVYKVVIWVLFLDKFIKEKEALKYNMVHSNVWPWIYNICSILFSNGLTWLARTVLKTCVFKKYKFNIKNQQANKGSISKRTIIYWAHTAP